MPKKKEKKTQDNPLKKLADALRYIDLLLGNVENSTDPIWEHRAFCDIAKEALNEIYSCEREKDGLLARGIALLLVIYQELLCMGGIKEDGMRLSLIKLHDSCHHHIRLFLAEFPGAEYPLLRPGRPGLAEDAIEYRLLAKKEYDEASEHWEKKAILRKYSLKDKAALDNLVRAARRSKNK